MICILLIIFSAIALFFNRLNLFRCSFLGFYQHGLLRHQGSLPGVIAIHDLILELNRVLHVWKPQRDGCSADRNGGISEYPAPKALVYREVLYM